MGQVNGLDVPLPKDDGIILGVAPESNIALGRDVGFRGPGRGLAIRLWGDWAGGWH